MSPKLEKSPTSISNRLRWGSLWIVFGRALAMVLVFANLALLAKLMPEPEFSAYVVTISIVSLASVAAMFGLNYLVCKLIAAYRAVGDHSNALRSARIVFGVGLITSVLISSVVATGCYFQAEVWFHRPMISNMWSWIGLWILLLAIGQIIAEVFRGLHNLFAAAILAGVSGGLFANAIFFLGIVWVYFQSELTYQIVIQMAALSFVLPLVVSGAWLILCWPRPEGEPTPDTKIRPVQLKLPQRIEVKSVLAEAFPIMLLSFVALGFDRAGQLIAGGFGTEDQVAVFEGTWQLAFIPIVPLTMLGLAIASSVSELHAQQDKQTLERIIKVSSTISLIVAIPIIFMLTIMGGPLLALIFGSSFSVGWSALIVLCIIQLMRNWMGPCDVLLVMTGHQIEAFVCFVIASPLLLLGPWSVHEFGLMGLTSVIAMAILVSRILQYFVVVRKLGVSPHAELNYAFLKSLVQFSRGTQLLGKQKQKVS